jgi:hypothetical protein
VDGISECSTGYSVSPFFTVVIRQEISIDVPIRGGNVGKR